MRCAIVTVALSLAGCAITPSDGQPVAPSLSGKWVGEIHWRSSLPVEGATSGTHEVVLANCNGEPRFFWRQGDAYSRSTATYRYASSHSTHMLYFIVQAGEADPQWVETQSWALIEVPGEELKLSWSRSVNNRLSDASDPGRAFTQVGIGQLRKVSSDCGDFT